MNSVHEPSPNGDSKISSSRKPVRKTKPDAQAPSWPCRHAQVRIGAPKRVHAHARAVVSWPGPGRVVAKDRSYRRRQAAVSQPSLARPALCRAPTPCRAARLPSAVSQAAPRPCRRRKATRLASRVLGWLCCIATQPSLSSLSQSQYNFCIATYAFSALKPTSVTIVLQYNCQPAQLIAIHLNPVIQFLPHNTNWAVANFPNFCTKFFFSLFIINIFFPLFQ